MSRFFLALMLAGFSFPLCAQTSGRRPIVRRDQASMQALAAEMAVKQAMDQLGALKKAYDRDLELLQHLRTADEALTDPMQPNNAIQKGLDEVGAARSLSTDFLVTQGVIRAQQELENARRSPTSADFGRLRSILMREATAPATRLVARNGARLQEEALSWIKVQELVSAHLRSLAEIGAESLRAVIQ